MAILTEIDCIPLYTSKEAALSWGKKHGLSGYHVHVFGGQIGYMGGINHSEANKRLIKATREQAARDVAQEVQPAQTPLPTQNQDMDMDIDINDTTVTTGTTTGATTGGASGGGGGY